MRSLCFLLAAGLTGCAVHERYLVDRPRLLALSRMPDAERETVVVPAVRHRDRVATHVRATSLPLAPAAWVSDPVPVRTSVPSPMTTAGAVITLIGSAISVTGTVGFLAMQERPFETWSLERPGAAAFAAVGLAAEPVMLLGTALWIVGLSRRPQEARSGGGHLRLLGPGGELSAW